MEYQIQPKPNTYFRLRESVCQGFRPHLHGFYELIWCDEGQARVTVGGCDYVVAPGEAVLIFPYQVHSYPDQSGGVWHLCTFASEMIAAFSGQYADSMPVSNLFRFTWDISAISNESSLYAKKAFLYSMCDTASTQMRFTASSADKRQLLEKMFTYIEKHFTEPDFSLRHLSEQLTYDYGYLSKFFFEKTGVKFNHYLNLRRITYAGELLRKNLCVNIEDAAYTCGYSSVRSFNRNFKSIHGITPLEYIENKTGQY